MTFLTSSTAKTQHFERLTYIPISYFTFTYTFAASSLYLSLQVFTKA